MRIITLIFLLTITQNTIGQKMDTLRVTNRYDYLDLDNSENFIYNMEHPSKVVVKKGKHTVIATFNINTEHSLKIFCFSEAENDTLTSGWSYNNPYNPYHEEVLVSGKNNKPFLNISSLPKGKYELHLYIGLYIEKYRLIIK